MRARTATGRATATATVLFLAACGGSLSAPAPRTHPTTSRTATIAPRANRGPSCNPAPIVAGALPAWTAAAWSDSSPGLTVPYALATGNAAAAFFFAPTLRAGHPTNPTNKVLWVVRFPRDGHPLTITARLSTNQSEVMRITRPADSSPGEIYPSYVDLPKPGCWRLELAWGTHRASLDVQVRPGS